MCTWEIPREKWVPHPGGLEFRFKYHLNREKGRGYSFKREEVIFFQKNKKALRRIDEINDSLWQICLNVVYISSIFLSDETPEQRTYDNKMPFAVSTFKQIRGVIRKFFLAFAIFKCL